MTGIFWLASSLLVYAYLGYPVLVWVLARAFGREPQDAPIAPSVSLLIPAYNEEAHIEARVRNSLALSYPRDQLEIVVASDGSTDRTNAIVESFAPRGVQLVVMPTNIGKAAMLTRVVPRLRGEIVVFSDASSELHSEALTRLMRRFADPQVGCVCGLYRLQGSSQDLRGEGEGLYWRYEVFIKQQESRLHSILGAHGAFYAIRKALFTPLESTAINDDYLIPMRIIEQGYRAVYEPSAVAVERDIASVEGEFARRRRIAAGNCQQIAQLLHLLNPLRGWVALTFFSHKVLRTLAPLLMIAVLVTSLWLPQPWSAVALFLQALLYGSAWAGYCCQRRGRRIRWLSPPLYFCLGNLAMLAGLFNYCFRRNELSWERAK